MTFRPGWRNPLRDDRRVAHFTCSWNFFLDILDGLGRQDLIVRHELPKDARILGVQSDGMRDGLIITIESEDYPERPDNAYLMEPTPLPVWIEKIA